MNVEGHWRRALELEASIDFLLTDPQSERHLAAIVEAAFGAAQHLIAYALEQRYGAHPDTHAGIGKQLREHAHNDIADLFGQPDQLRMGRWYSRKVWYYRE